MSQFRGSDGTTKSCLHARARARARKLPHSLKFMQKRPLPSGTRYGRSGSDYSAGSSLSHTNTHTHTMTFSSIYHLADTVMKTGNKRALVC